MLGGVNGDCMIKCESQDSRAGGRGGENLWFCSREDVNILGQALNSSLSYGFLEIGQGLVFFGE